MEVFHECLLREGLFRKCGILDGLILTASAMSTLAIAPSQINCLKSEHE